MLRYWKIDNWLLKFEFKLKFESNQFKFQDEQNSLPVLEKADRPPITSDMAGREPILKVFEEAGIPALNASMIQQLPTWDEIVNLIGPHPIVGGLDTCEAFKQNVPAVERMLGSSGMVSATWQLIRRIIEPKPWVNSYYFSFSRFISLTPAQILWLICSRTIAKFQSELKSMVQTLQRKCMEWDGR